MDSLFKSEKDVALGVSKLTKIIVYFRDANVTKKRILISSMVTLWSLKKVYDDVKRKVPFMELQHITYGGG